MKLAIYGYDTIVGKLVLEALEQDESLKLDEFYPLSPLASEYDAVPLRGKNYLISYVDEFDFSKADVALFLTTKDESERLIPKAQSAGCIVIDDSHLYAGIKGKTMVLKEVNPYAVKDVIESKLACVPLATSSEIVLSLNPLHDEYGIKKAVITAMISTSEHGELGTQTLARETTQLLNGMGVDVTDFPAQLAFNIHTRIGELDDDGISSHEQIVIHEVFSLMDKFPEGLALTCVQVPTFYGHTLSVHVDLEEDCSVDELKAAFKQSTVIALEEELKLDADDVDADADTDTDAYTEADSGEAKSQALVTSNKNNLVSPVSCAEMESKLYVARIRKQGRASFDFTVVMDNTRHGEATAAVDLLQLLQSKIG